MRGDIASLRSLCGLSGRLSCKLGSCRPPDSAESLDVLVVSGKVVFRVERQLPAPAATRFPPPAATRFKPSAATRFKPSAATMFPPLLTKSDSAKNHRARKRMRRGVTRPEGADNVLAQVWVLLSK